MKVGNAFRSQIVAASYKHDYACIPVVNALMMKCPHGWAASAPDHKIPGSNPALHGI